jgi:predicted HAD superfamily Cof-like phosphohydrolase
MSGYFTDVGEFHRKFNIPAFDPRKACQFPSTEIIQYRLKFLREEIKEFEDACLEGNLVEALDAIADIVYVAMGTGHYFNMPFPNVWIEVQRANMERILCTRENCPPDKQYRADMVIKPAGWRPPDIAAILEHQNFFARRMARVLK